ncbi:hypothetical protein HYFRA_00008500 [Hymenoscyphus fraxineus]|uniref:Uncharacterized protein n=1 Tax=Hymenoscyphus fraxineus TaxID=746836 RepID=A0A9N9KRJ4_9HELO|nr:hypothetical protein HYFRA_00008500 [Hymenoscyphus fraxineus]
MGRTRKEAAYIASSPKQYSAPARNLANGRAALHDFLLQLCLWSQDIAPVAIIPDDRDIFSKSRQIRAAESRKEPSTMVLQYGEEHMLSE